MEVNRLYLDTNILIVLGEGQGEAVSLLTELLVRQPTGQRPIICTSELTLAEVLVKPYREENDRLTTQYENWLVPGGLIEIGPINPTVLRYAAVLRARYRAPKLPDAIHLSTAIGFGCSHFLSGDTRLPERVELLHPRSGITKGPATVDVVRPQVEILSDILEALRKA